MQKKKFTFIGIVIITLICAGCIIYNLPGNKITRQINLGYKYLEEMEYEQALVVFNEILKIEPRNAEGYLGMLEVYISMSDFETALKYAEEGYEMTGDERLKEKVDMIKSGNIFSYLGYPMKKTVYSETGNVGHSLKYTYNKKGQKASVTEFDRNGKQVGYIKLEYDQDGNPLTGYGVRYFLHGGLFLYEYEYKDGLRVKTTQYKDYSGSEVEFIDVTERNEKGKVIKSYRYDSEGKEVSCDTVEYDSQGRPFRQNVYKENELSQYLIYEWSEDGREKRILYYDASGKISEDGIWFYEYDEEGRMIKLLKYDASNKLKEYSIYEYDEDGGSTATWYNSEGEVTWKQSSKTE